MQICLRRSGNNFYSPALHFTSRAGLIALARVCISLSLSTPQETLDSLGRKLIIRYLLSCVLASSHKKRAETGHAVCNCIARDARRKQHRARERVNYILCAEAYANVHIFIYNVHTRGQGIMAPRLGGGEKRWMDGSSPRSLFTSRLWCRCAALHPHAHLPFLIILSFDIVCRVLLPSEWARPLQNYPEDERAHGFQFGIGLRFRVRNGRGNKISICALLKENYKYLT